MPGLVKIGKTGRGVETRLNDLYTTGVPLPFECSYAAQVADMDKVEQAYHRAFGPYRINPRREFFEIEPEQAIGLLELLAVSDMTPQVQEEAASVDTGANAAAEKFKRARRPSLNYLDMGIPVGSTLLFSDGETTCTVADGRRLFYEGETLSITALTQRLKNEDRPLRGPMYWSFNGRSLDELYEETYSD